MHSSSKVVLRIRCLASALCSPCAWRQMKLWLPAHVADSVLQGAQMLASYVLMLIAMTFSVWLLIAVIVGSTLGYWFFEGVSPLVLPTRRRSAACRASSSAAGPDSAGVGKGAANGMASDYENQPQPLA